MLRGRVVMQQQQAAAGGRARAPVAATSCRHWKPQPLRRRRTLVVPSSGGKDGPQQKEPGGGDGGPGKADFSAYWSLKIKQMFDNRRKYIEEIERKGIPESEVVQKLEQRAGEQLQELMDVEAEQQELRQLKLEARRQLQEDPALLKGTAEAKAAVSLLTPQEAAAEVERDVRSARDSLRTAAVFSPSLSWYRAAQIIRAVLLSPFNLALSLRQQWTALYSSQRYENFLMAEGERIWYWRNRTENERWFWEIIVWDRLLLPILCCVAYELLVPNHFFWALVMPLTFIAMQSGALPHWRSLEFWLLAYFGFYKKVWPDCLVLIRSLMWG